MTTPIPFVDCEGLAGAWTLGTVLTGDFELVARKSLPGGFGDNAIAANQHLVGEGWTQQTGLREGWDPAYGVGYVCGTPPCSGFSLLNTSKGKNARGSGSDINACMKDLVLYAATCKGLDGELGPEVVSFESVQGAYKQGRDLMQELRRRLESATGQEYDITHVLMSGASVGSAQMRHRYYLVLHRIPFYIESPKKRRVITYSDAIGDLVGADFKREPQAYPDEPKSDWARKLRADALDMHIIPETGAFAHLVRDLSPYWRPGEPIDPAVRRYHDVHGSVPPSIKPERWIGDDPDSKQALKGWSWPRRVAPDKSGYVLTGAGILSNVHWAEDRLFSVRECSRLMGYPDSWDWSFAKSPMQASMLIGKCCPVQSGRWISSWVAEAIKHAYDLGSSYEDGGGDVTVIGDREYLHDSTAAYKPWLAEQREATQQLH